MRLELLLLLALIIIGGAIYYQEDGFKDGFSNPFATSSSTATSTKKTLSLKERFFGGKNDLKIPDDIDGEIAKSQSKNDTSKAETSESQTSVKTTTETKTTVTNPGPDKAAIAAEANDISDQLSELEDQVAKLAADSKLSPYKDMVTFKVGNAKVTEADKEYLTITANSSNAGAVTISDWSVTSEVTNKEGTIPEGIRLLNRRTSRSTSPITLNPGETAYINTGNNPLYESFRENLCTGYLADFAPYNPGLTKSCPLPSDELLVYGDLIRENDDDCFEFIGDIKRCETIDDDELQLADLDNECEDFVEDILYYEGCVLKHQNDANFFTGGAWRIYFDKGGELWLSSNETIVLKDQNDKEVARITY